MKQIKINQFLNHNFPQALASDFDFGKIGLQFGDSNKDVKKVLIALDITSNVINQAIKNSCDLIICHHPFLFHPILSLDYNSIFAQNLFKIINHNLNIYSMHTNFDVSKNGMNDILAQKLGLKNIFFIGDEINKDSLIRIGEIDQLSLTELLLLVSKTFNQPHLKFVGDQNQIIKKVAIVGGSGSSQLKYAISNGCDCLITGEIPHHLALEANELNFSLIEISHFAESFFKFSLKDFLEKNIENVEFIVAKEEDPFNYF